MIHYYMPNVIHIRVGKKIKKEMMNLIKDELFTNQTEIAREAIRDLILKYREEKK